MLTVPNVVVGAGITTLRRDRRRRQTLQLVRWSTPAPRRDAARHSGDRRRWHGPRLRAPTRLHDADHGVRACSSTPRIVALTTSVAVGLGSACSSAGGVAGGRPGQGTARLDLDTDVGTDPDVPRYKPTTPVFEVRGPRASRHSVDRGQHRLVALGLNPDGTMQVPAEWRTGGLVRGWPRPGADGPAVIAGQVDSKLAPPTSSVCTTCQAGNEVLTPRRSLRRALRDRPARTIPKSVPHASVFARRPDRRCASSPVPVPSTRPRTATSTTSSSLHVSRAPS